MSYDLAWMARRVKICTNSSSTTSSLRRIRGCFVSWRRSSRRPRPDWIWNIAPLCSPVNDRKQVKRTMDIRMVRWDRVSLFSNDSRNRVRALPYWTNAK
jgi:hypothetical protein